MKRKELIILSLIFLTGVFLRFYRLAEIPPGLHYDEASFAYNAWSILKTGRDEFDNFLPLNIRAFDDWRPPVYTYLTSFSFLLFGVSDFALRFPSALAGVCLILIVYFFVRDFIGSSRTALFAAFLTAFNPTLIMFSRAAYDSNLALTLAVACFWFFWKGIKSKKVGFFIGSLFLASLAFLTYQASKVFVPLMLLVFTLVYRRKCFEVLKIKRNLLILLFFSFLFSIPVIACLSESKGLFRFSSISIFRQEKLLKTSIDRLLFNKNKGFSLFNPFANRRLLFGQEIILRYLDNYNPSFLFAYKLEPSMHYIPNFGAFFCFEIALFLIGVFALARQLEKKKKIIIVSWFFLVAIPAAPLATAPYITRILPIVPVIIVAISFALQKIWNKAPLLIIATYSFFIAYMGYSLFVLLPSENGKVWQVGYRQMVETAWQWRNKYEKIYVSNSLQRPYIFFLWYGKYNPVLYQPHGAKRAGSGLSPEVEFENFVFSKFSPKTFVKAEKNLYIGTPADFPKEFEVLEEIGCGEGERQECIWLVEEII